MGDGYGGHHSRHAGAGKPGFPASISIMGAERMGFGKYKVQNRALVLVKTLVWAGAFLSITILSLQAIHELGKAQYKKTHRLDHDIHSLIQIYDDSVAGAAGSKNLTDITLYTLMMDPVYSNKMETRYMFSSDPANAEPGAPAFGGVEHSIMKVHGQNVRKDSPHDPHRESFTYSTGMSGYDPDVHVPHLFLEDFASPEIPSAYKNLMLAVLIISLVVVGLNVLAWGMVSGFFGQDEVHPCFMSHTWARTIAVASLIAFSALYNNSTGERITNGMAISTFTALAGLMEFTSSFSDTFAPFTDDFAIAEAVRQATGMSSSSGKV